MRSRSVLYLTLAMITAVIFVTSLSAQTGGAAPNESTTDITVPGETGLKWLNTGITVAAGDIVRLDAKGEIDVGGSWGVHGPEGTTKFSEQPPGYYPVESKMRYGLAARITLGSGRKYQPTQTWIYGEKKELQVTRSGMLWLTVNDDAPEGNVGEFAVRITVVKKKK